MAQIQRFITLTLHKPKEKFPYVLTSQELNKAKISLIKMTQKKFYSDEYTKLQKNEIISSKSCLKTLNPFLNEQGLLRVNGRLAYSNISYGEGYPVILPYGSHLCEIFLKFLHHHLLHADVSLMLNMVRYQFYIPGVKRAVKKFIHSCITCTRYKQQVKNQIMAALPPERSTFSTAFSFTGVDFAGPFQIEAGDLRNSPYVKGYASLFVGFSTRAIHLEVCSSLTSEAFLAAFARFVSRRGLPTLVMSDNGTYFDGAFLRKRHAKALFILDRIAKNAANATPQERDELDRVKYQIIVDEY